MRQNESAHLQVNQTTPVLPSTSEKQLGRRLAVGGGILVLFGGIIIGALLLVQSFLGASVGGEVDRVRKDLRSISVGVEFYRSDNDEYPTSIAYTAEQYEKLSILPHHFSSFLDEQRTSGATMLEPVRYLTLHFPDPFSPLERLPYAYYSTGDWYILSSAGPDRDYDLISPFERFSPIDSIPNDIVMATYDATNGIVSNGDIWRVANE